MARDFNIPPLSLGLLKPHARHHRAAWWWLGWLYRNPAAFQDALEEVSFWPAIRAGLALGLHSLPWIFVSGVSLRVLPTEAGLAHPFRTDLALVGRWLAAAGELGEILGIVAFGCLAIFLCSVVFNFVILRLSGRPVLAPSDGSFFGPFGALACGPCAVVILWLLTGLMVGRGFFDLIFGFFGGLVATLVIRLVVEAESSRFWLLFLSLAFGLLFGFAVSPVCSLGFFLAAFRLFYLPVHVALCFLPGHPECYRFHPAAWDWMCLLPFPRLDRLLVSYSERSPLRMEPEIDRLISEVPDQRTQALRAFTILRARRAARIDYLIPLSAALADLPEGTKGFLADTRRVRELVEEIVRGQRRVDETSRAYFREVELQRLVTLIENFRMQVSGMQEPVATEFRKAAEKWLRLAKAQLEQTLQVAGAEPAPQVFRAGDPVQRAWEAFVPRFRVLEELVGQVMLGSGCPGILLRGPRRMGKSSLLRNVSGFLPREVGVVAVSLQSARFFCSLGHLVGGLAQAMSDHFSAVPELAAATASLREIRPSDLPGFSRFLDESNAALDGAGQRLLLALDEYEMIDEKLADGVFPKDLLATLRESIQSHRRIIWAFSGNAEITELTSADWTSYLISVRTLEVPVFTLEETHLLLTEPLKHSALGEKDKAKSALFWKEFWGEDGLARIHAEAGGWPYFVQLIAETAVTLANESGRVGGPRLEPALDASVERGNNTFHQLLRSQSRLPGEWEYLAAFARHETQRPPEHIDVRRSLERRRLLVGLESECRLRVPLMARWLRKEA